MAASAGVCVVAAGRAGVDRRRDGGRRATAMLRLRYVQHNAVGQASTPAAGESPFSR